ncbi:MAG: sel1 repeat family protein [Burkholderiales bacterium]|nr:sel1 repeat family protein [Burkholderiales bacterium]
MKTHRRGARFVPAAARLVALLAAVSWFVPAPAAPDVPPRPSIASLRERAATGDAQARYDLGVAMLCRRGIAKDPDEAARLLTAAAGQGHAGAQSVLGWMLMSGRGVPHDDRRAAVWLQRAAEAGDTAAANNLGVLYATGQGVARDDAAAERWFRVAADQGAEMAAENLSVLRGDAGQRPARTSRSGGLPPALVAAGCGGLPRAKGAKGV